MQNIRVEFPRYPQELLSDTAVRHAYAKASANVTFALEESGISHNRNLNAAMVTAATHDLNLDRTSKEYVEEAIEQLVVASMETHDEEFQEQLDSLSDRLWNLRDSIE